MRPRPAASRIDVRKTYKLYVGGAFPRSESGRTYLVSTPEARSWRTPAAPRARTFAMRSARPARRFEPWAAATAMNRGQVLYRVAELMEGRRDQFVAEVAAAEGLSRRRAATASTTRSTAGSGTPAGPTRSPRSWARRTRSRRRTSTSRSPRRPGWSASSRRSRARCSASSAGSPRSSSRATRRSSSPRSPGRCRP